MSMSEVRTAEDVVIAQWLHMGPSSGCILRLYEFDRELFRRVTALMSSDAAATISRVTRPPHTQIQAGRG